MPDDRFIDVRFADLMADPLAAIRVVYDRLGLELTDEATRRMRTYLDGKPRGRHGAELPVHRPGCRRGRDASEVLEIHEPLRHSGGNGMTELAELDAAWLDYSDRVKAASEHHRSGVHR